MAAWCLFGLLVMAVCCRPTESETDVQISPRRLELVEGDPFTLQCEGPNQLQWSFNGQPLARDDPRFSMVSWDEESGRGSRHRSMLTAAQTGRALSGNYTCSDAMNDTIQDAVRVEVRGRSPDMRLLITRPAGDVNVTVGDAVTIKCHAGRAASLFWTFNYALLAPSTGDYSMMMTVTMSGEQIMGLNFDAISMSWSGQFSCMDHVDITNSDSVWVHVSANNSNS